MKKSNIVVLKFGGTSMGTAESIKSCADVIISKIKEKKNPFVVVSAMSKITDGLLKLLNLQLISDTKLRTFLQTAKFFLEKLWVFAKNFYLTKKIPQNHLVKLGDGHSQFFAFKRMRTL